MMRPVDAIHAFSGGPLTVSGPNATAAIFATYPADYLSLWGGFLDQVLDASKYLLLILCVQYNNRLQQYYYSTTTDYYYYH